MSRILFADDDVAMRYMVADMLMAAGHAVQAVADGAMALHVLRAEPSDLVLLDYKMGRPDGFEVCRRIKDDPALRHIPVLILTGIGEIEDRIRGFAAGANDFLPKPFDPRELLARVNALLRLSEHGKDLNPTSGLPGGDAIAREFERRRSSGKPFTLCYLDLNDFKAFNDHFGFAAANAVIEAVGEAMRHAIARTRAFAGHIGGDDFVMMCTAPEARLLVGQVQRRLAEAVARLVPQEVATAGKYWGRSRTGADEHIGLTRAVAVLLHLPGGGGSPSLESLGEIAAESKQRLKSDPRGGLAEIEIGEPEVADCVGAPQGQAESPPSLPRRSSRKW